jgi:hypothetical protein
MHGNSVTIEAIEQLRGTTWSHSHDGSCLGPCGRSRTPLSISVIHTALTDA